MGGTSSAHRNEKCVKLLIRKPEVERSLVGHMGVNKAIILKWIVRKHLEGVVMWLRTGISWEFL
jgi:hypothetical protein